MCLRRGRPDDPTVPRKWCLMRADWSKPPVPQSQARSRAASKTSSCGFLKSAFTNVFDGRGTHSKELSLPSAPTYIQYYYYNTFDIKPMMNLYTHQYLCRGRKKHNGGPTARPTKSHSSGLCASSCPTCSSLLLNQPSRLHPSVTSAVRLFPV